MGRRDLNAREEKRLNKDYYSFKGIDVSKLPVMHFSQTNDIVWMTGEILDEVITKLNRHLSSSSWSVVLLMDNAGCHPHELNS